MCQVFVLLRVVLCPHKMRMFKSWPSAPQDVTSLGNQVAAGMDNWDEVTEVGPNLIWPASF